MTLYNDLLQVDRCYQIKHRWARLIGLFCLLGLLSGCQTALSPTQTTTTFWKAMTEGDIESAREYATRETQSIVTIQPNLKGASLKTEQVVIDGPNAKVETILTLREDENNKLLSFDTVLSKENDLWKVDYRQTTNSLSFLPFGEVFNSLRAIGDVINKQLEQQLPLFENQIKSISEELIRQLDEFRRELENNNPSKEQLLPPV